MLLGGFCPVNTLQGIAHDLRLSSPIAGSNGVAYEVGDRMQVQFDH